MIRLELTEREALLLTTWAEAAVRPSGELFRSVANAAGVVPSPSEYRALSDRLHAAVHIPKVLAGLPHD